MYYIPILSFNSGIWIFVALPLCFNYSVPPVGKMTVFANIVYTEAMDTKDYKT